MFKLWFSILLYVRWSINRSILNIFYIVVCCTGLKKLPIYFRSSMILNNKLFIVCFGASKQQTHTSTNKKKNQRKFFHRFSHINNVIININFYNFLPPPSLSFPLFLSLSLMFVSCLCLFLSLALFSFSFYLSHFPSLSPPRKKDTIFTDKLIHITTHYERCN